MFSDQLRLESTVPVARNDQREFAKITLERLATVAVTGIACVVGDGRKPGVILINATIARRRGGLKVQTAGEPSVNRRIGGCEKGRALRPFSLPDHCTKQKPDIRPDHPTRERRQGEPH